MENFKHLPEPFRIRVIEPVKRTTRAGDAANLLI